MCKFHATTKVNYVQNMTPRGPPGGASIPKGAPGVS